MKDKNEKGPLQRSGPFIIKIPAAGFAKRPVVLPGCADPKNMPKPMAMV
ncbi:MAG: hypothetical protein WA946_05280 [Nitrospirota bacterium]